MKPKTKTALELLEKEVTRLTEMEAMSATGGDDPSNDCVYLAIAFATGRPVSEIRQCYGEYLVQYWSAGGSGQSAAYWLDMYDVKGVPVSDAAWLAYTFGLTSQGDTPSGASGSSFEGDQSVAFLAPTLYQQGHAVVLTGNANAYEYYYYDPQDGETKTIAKDSPRIIGTYGYD